MAATPSASSAPSALDSLLSDPIIGGIIGAAPQCAKLAQSARQERALLVARAAAAAAAPAPSASGVPSSEGAAPIIRAPWIGSVPAVDPHYSVPADVEATLRVYAQAGAPLLLTGPAGAGKSEAIRWAAARAERPFLKVDCGPVREASDWFGTMTSAGGGRIGWQDSALVAALATPGAVILLDELNRSHTSAQNGLLGLLDGSRAVWFPARAEPVTVADGVWICASANIGVSFAGTGALDAALRDRFAVLPCDYLDREDEAALLRRRVPAISAQSADDLARLAEYTRTSAWVNAGGEAVSTRALIRCAAMCAAFLAAGSREGLAVRALVTMQPDDGGSSQSPRAQLAAYIARTYPRFA